MFLPSRWKFPPSLKLIVYNYPLPSYRIIAADTLCDLVTLTCDLLTLSVDLYGGSCWMVNPSTKFEVDMTIRCLVIALLLLIHYVTLWPWPFDFGQWSYMAGHVVNPSTKFEDPMAIRSWVMSSDFSHRIPLTMHLQPLRMRHTTWPTHSGKFFPHI